MNMELDGSMNVDSYVEETTIRTPERKPTPEELRNIAQAAIDDMCNRFKQDVKECVRAVIANMEERLASVAATGSFELHSTVNSCDHAYVKEHDIAEFEDAVNVELRKYWEWRGFEVPKVQGNYFEISWAIPNSRGNDLRYTPEGFAKAMEEIAESDMAEEESHITADELMLATLKKLGYEKGCKVFEDMDNWYC